MNPRHAVLAIAAAAALALGCGGAQKEESMKDRILEEEDDGTSVVDSLVGDAPALVEEEQTEVPTETAEVAPEVAPEDVVEGGKGAFVATLKVMDEKVDGKISVKTATEPAEIVVENVPSGKEILLDPGTYDVIITTDAVAGMEEFPLKNVEIPMGRRIEREVKIPAGQITLVTGARCAKRPIRIRRKGATDWLSGKYTTCKPIILMAGEYEAEMGGGKRGTPISGIQVYDGGIREILIRKKQ